MLIAPPAPQTLFQGYRARTELFFFLVWLNTPLKRALFLSAFLTFLHATYDSASHTHSQKHTSEESDSARDRERCVWQKETNRHPKLMLSYYKNQYYKTLYMYTSVAAAAHITHRNSTINHKTYCSNTTENITLSIHANTQHIGK